MSIYKIDGKIFLTELSSSFRLFLMFLFDLREETLISRFVGILIYPSVLFLNIFTTMFFVEIFAIIPTLLSISSTIPLKELLKIMKQDTISFSILFPNFIIISSIISQIFGNKKLSNFLILIYSIALVFYPIIKEQTVGFISLITNIILWGTFVWIVFLVYIVSDTIKKSVRSYINGKVKNKKRGF